MQFNVQFLVQGKGRVEDMKPYVQYMNHLLRTYYDAVSDDDRFELSYNDYLQARALPVRGAVPPTVSCVYRFCSYAGGDYVWAACGSARF